MVDRVLTELAGQHERMFLVIDDLHELRSPEALAQLTSLLTSLPPHTHAIVATRRDLPLRLHQLRLAGELAELRAAELRFSLPETRELLAASGITLSGTGAALLHERTEGWAAGLRLAALSLAGQADPERFVAEFSGSSRAVAEYLMAEMLECQPAEVQQLLLRTSLLDRVNGELADLLTGRPGSERILLDLEDANAFVVSLDPQRSWFRYHHLFADLLRLELRRRLPADVPALHRLAAAGSSSMARSPTRSGTRRRRATGRTRPGCWPITRSASRWTGRPRPSRRCCRRSRRAAADGLDLALARATIDLARGRLDEGAAHLAVAETLRGEGAPGRQHRLQVALASLQLSLARRRGNLAGVLDQVNFLTAPVSGQSDEDIALDSDLRAVALMNLGIVEAWSLANEDSVRHLQEGAELARAIGLPYLEVACLAQLAFASKIAPLGTTRRLCRQAIALAERHGWGAEPIIAPALVNLAGALIWVGELDEAEGLLRRTARALETDTGPGIRLLLHLATGMYYAGRGR